MSVQRALFVITNLQVSRALYFTAWVYKFDWRASTNKKLNRFLPLHMTMTHAGIKYLKVTSSDFVIITLHYITNINREKRL